jgi:signal transduction histidine kinase
LHPYDEFQGSGVGLSICKKIIEKHNGFITSRSRDGEGSTFIIGIPQALPETKSQESAPLSLNALPEAS